MALKDTLARKAGPLKVWQWGAVGIGAGALVIWLRSRKKPAAQTQPQAQPGPFPFDLGTAGGGGGGADGQQPQPPLPEPAPASTANLSASDQGNLPLLTTAAILPTSSTASPFNPSVQQFERAAGLETRQVFEGIQEGRAPIGSGVTGSLFRTAFASERTPFPERSLSIAGAARPVPARRPGAFPGLPPSGRAF